MANVRDRQLSQLTAQQAVVLREEAATAKAVAAAYEQARRDLLAEFMERVALLGPNPTPGQLRTLSNDAALIRAMTNRLAQLEQQLGAIIGDSLGDSSTAAFEAAVAEIAQLAAAAGAGVFEFGFNDLVELTIRPAIDQIPDLVAAVRAGLLADMRAGLAAGERIGDLAGRLFSSQAGPFPRGATSAQLMTRRAVIQADNNAKLLYYERAQAQLPDLQKQVIAKTGSARTTDLCLRAHGQIRDLDEPFSLSGTPDPFARQMQQPPFHWNCRTSVAAYLPQFDAASNMTTRSMRAQASKELEARADE